MDDNTPNRRRDVVNPHPELNRRSAVQKSNPQTTLQFTKKKIAVISLEDMIAILQSRLTKDEFINLYKLIYNDADDFLAELSQVYLDEKTK